MLILRDEDRYGTFSAFSEQIGECIVKIDICGWGDSFEVFKDGQRIFYDRSCFNEYCDGDFLYLEEDDKCFTFWTKQFANVAINKETLKRIKGKEE